MPTSSEIRTASRLARALAAAVLTAAVTPAGAASKVAQPAFEACLRDLLPQAQAAGLTPDRFSTLMAGLSPDNDVLDKLDSQPEFILTTGEYIQRVVNPRRIDAGREQLAQHQALLDALEARTGVRRETLIAIWGVETNFGTTRGSHDLLRSLGTLSCFGRRQPFFRRELMAALQIVDAGHVPRESFRGSWAGAFGHTQFMPTTFLRMSVDFDGDGHRNLVENLGDALASTANYLVRNGWQTGLPWGVEVRLPANMVLDAESRKDRRAVADWTGLGVTAADPTSQKSLSALAPDTKAALLRPDDAGGPVLLVFENFNAVYSYNPSVKYALAINHLADRIAGLPGFVEPWPASARALDHDARQELQRLLLGRGHAIGPVDGIIGQKTRAAIRHEQHRLGLPVDGRPSQALIDALGRRGG
ncbi:MAG: lytic murein transglycosylase [Burkholderiaceae bacterium]